MTVEQPASCISGCCSCIMMQDLSKQEQSRCSCITNWFWMCTVFSWLRKLCIANCQHNVTVLCTVDLHWTLQLECLECTTRKNYCQMFAGPGQNCWSFKHPWQLQVQLLERQLSVCSKCRVIMPDVPHWDTTISNTISTWFALFLDTSWGSWQYQPSQRV